MLEPQLEGPEELCDACHTLYRQGLIYSAGGNVSVRAGDEVYITPTGGALGQMKPENLVRVQLDGNVIGPGRPSKELGMHLAMYQAQPEARAVIHPHPPHAVAYSARYPTPGLNVILPTNAGFYIRAGQVPMLPYFHSGSPELHEAVDHLAREFAVVLLGNHGVIAAGPTLLHAINIVEELEQNCQVLLLAGEGARGLTAGQCADIDRKLGRAWPSPVEYQDWFTMLQNEKVPL